MSGNKTPMDFFQFNNLHYPLITIVILSAFVVSSTFVIYLLFVFYHIFSSSNSLLSTHFFALSTLLLYFHVARLNYDWFFAIIAIEFVLSYKSLTAIVTVSCRRTRCVTACHLKPDLLGSTNAFIWQIYANFQALNNSEDRNAFGYK